MLALHLCLIYLLGCGPHWRFYKWHVIPLCLTFIFKEVCFNGRAVRRPVSPWLAAAQQHADGRRHSAESQSTDNYRKGASSIPRRCRLDGRTAGWMSVRLYWDESSQYWQSLILKELGNIFFSLPLLIFNWSLLITMKTLSPPCFQWHSASKSAINLKWS